MNKEQFNNLNILEQIEYINSQLDKDSLTKVCKTIGVNRSTISKRFKSKGYELIDNRYINVDDTKDIVNTKNATNTKAQKKSNNSNDIKAL